eukprot:TRINITY_DN6480_c0_g2_i1.p1 TRINITY_DN6480_c0_g2~~TRINITY_DN6480_c0_g2_i1.p1  ORF type:complete len:190 (-),score=30.60 TRINITY_DN6480_c0_g2_i1:134-703(-)
MDHLAKKLKITKMEDWYDVTVRQVLETIGKGLLRKYKSSPSCLVMSMFTEHKWDVSKFARRKGIWDDLQLQRNVMSDLAKRLNIKKMEDWYDVGVVQIYENGGKGLLYKHGNSPSKMIVSVLNHHKWDLSRFINRKGVLDDFHHRVELMDQLAKRLDIKQVEDWYHVTSTQIRQNGGGYCANTIAHRPR